MLELPQTRWVHIRLNARNSNESTLNKYATTNPTDTQNLCGTTVSFYNIASNVDAYQLRSLLPNHIAKEICWYLALKGDSAPKIFINGVVVEWEHLISDEENFIIPLPNSEDIIYAHYIRWHENLGMEYSRYYCISTDGREKFSTTTLLNKKGDGFYHSVYLYGNLFDQIDFSLIDDDAQDLFGSRSAIIKFKHVVQKTNEFLHYKRRPFLRETSNKLVDDYVKKGVFPPVNARNVWENQRLDLLKESIRGLYEVQPRIFTNLNLDQKKNLCEVNGFNT